MRFQRKTVFTILTMSGMVFLLYVFFKTRSVTTPSMVSLIKVFSLGNAGNEDIADPLLKAARKIGSNPGTLLVPVINNAYLPFAYNWLCHTQEMGLHSRTLIITTDHKTRDKLLQDWPNVSAVSMNITSLSGNQTYGHAGFLKVNAERHRSLYRLLQEGYEILHFDFDQVWLANPLPVLQDYAHLGYDAMFLRDGSNTPPVGCSGFIYIRNTVKSVKLWNLLSKTLDMFVRDKHSLKDLEKLPKHMSDQKALNKLMLSNAVKNLSYEMLDTDEFASGQWYRMKAEQRAKKPFVIHNNWIVGNQAKIERAKRFKHWFLKEDMKCNMDLVHKVIRH